MQIHELPTGTLGDSDYAAIDNGTNNRKLSLKSAINSLITAGVSAIQSALTTAQNNITALQNSMATANTNIGALQTKVGAASTSNVGDGSLAGAVGNVVMGTAATTLSGAIKEHEDQIGATDISGIADGTITGAIGDTDISGVGDGTVTGAIGALSVIGATYYDSGASTSLASATAANRGSVELPPGKYIIVVSANFASNATGRRIVSYSLESATIGSSGVDDMVSMPAVSGAVTTLSKTRIATLSETKTAYCVVRQDSGSSINVNGVIRAIRIA